MRPRQAAVLGLTLCGLCLGACDGSPARASGDASESGSSVVVLTGASFASVVLGGGARPCMVEFWSPNCPACAAMSATVATLAEEFRGRAVVGSVNVLTETDLSSRYAIRATPTFIFLRDGAERYRRVGVTSHQELAQLLQATVLGN